MPTDDRQLETAAQALARAQAHARRAALEAIRAARALLDAAALGWSGRPSEANTALRGIAELLDQQAARFADGQTGIPAPLMKTLLEALDQEIGRWERRAASDPDARAVLRTFLGLREILWELGLRPEDADAPAAGESAQPKPTRKRRRAAHKKAGPGRPSRVQRVDIQS